MQKCFEQFKLFLSAYGLTSDEFDQLIQSCELVQYNKGYLLMKECDQQSNIYFLNKGIVRNFVCTTQGDIKTYNFRIENSTVTGYAHYNYKDELKAKVNVECLEDCSFIKIPLIAIQKLVETATNSDKIGRYLAEAHVIELVDFIIETDTKSILERYYELEEKFPNIHQRVPQHIIASYLRTTPVHLSRAKSNFQKSKR